MLTELATRCPACRQRTVPDRRRIGGRRPRLPFRAPGAMPATVMGLAPALQAARPAAARHAAGRHAQHGVVGRDDDLAGELGPHKLTQAIGEAAAMGSAG